MSSFYRLVSKLLTTIGLKKNHQNFPLLPKPEESTTPTFENYTHFVVNHYKEEKHTVWEYSKEKGLEGNQIDLVIKQNQDILLINCRDMDEDVTIEDIHNFEKEASYFVSNNPIFENYTIKLLYALSSLLLEENAYKYIKKNPHISYKLLKINTN